MKFKAKKSFHSALGTFEKGIEYDIELDTYTLENWVENGLIGLISEVKKPNKKVVTEDENQ
jgi:hypothetical protein